MVPGRGARRGAVAILTKRGPARAFQSTFSQTDSETVPVSWADRESTGNGGGEQHLPSTAVAYLGHTLIASCAKVS